MTTPTAPITATLNPPTNPSPALIAQHLRANLLSVFNERDPAARRLAINTTYAPNVVWHEPGATYVGHEAIFTRAGELLAQNPGWSYVPVGQPSSVANAGVLRFAFGPAGQEPVVHGTDVVIVQDGLVVALWTAIEGPEGQQA
ncbi:uncharacterized protein LOC62_01G001372 [Vanrija pseudolonga]|uniref:SnoaL-like domain-containing protein n=1 Tax=Vanrija pseudolonga TaxID=143232 RepID=A0AAF0Y0X0_9TREE|nr:hypothetical protein LOC62_01G001372 [Vanrija pseudolonga]